MPRPDRGYDPCCSRQEAWSIASVILLIVAILVIITQIPALLHRAELAMLQRTAFALECGKLHGAIVREQGQVLCVGSDGHTLSRY